MQVLADPHNPEALARYAAALGKTLRSAQPVPVSQSTPRRLAPLLARARGRCQPHRGAGARALAVRRDRQGTLSRPQPGAVAGAAVGARAMRGSSSRAAKAHAGSVPAAVTCSAASTSLAISMMMIAGVGANR